MQRVNLKLNALQLAAFHSLERRSYLNRQQKKINPSVEIDIEGSRGVGKSFLLGGFARLAVLGMPGSTGILVGETYTQIKTRTLQSTKDGLKAFGIHEDYHYVVGRRHPKFKRPISSPDNWKNIIHFINGSIVAMVSLDNPNSGRGLNGYYVLGDEAALLSSKLLFDNVLTPNRAYKPHFEGCPMLGATIFASSVAMTQKGAWFTEREQKAKENPDNFIFLKANYKVNEHNLSPGYIQKMRDQSTSEIQFNAEILNIRPPAVSNAFYSQLNKNVHYYKHAYNNSLIGLDLKSDFSHDCRHDTDLIAGQPLELNLDFGTAINVATVSQQSKALNTKFFIKEFFVKSPKLLDDLIRLFIDYYAPHQGSCKEVHLFHDRNGHNDVPNSKTTLATDVQKLLESKGWKVTNKTPKGKANPPHILKYRLVNNILSHNAPVLPFILINQDNCPNLIISMERAPTKAKDDGFEKDKSSERSTVIKQEHATHFSDTFDYNLWWSYHHLLDYSFRDSYVVTNLF